MSAALLKRSLAIVEDDDNQKKDKRKQQNNLQGSRKYMNHQKRKFMPYDKLTNKKPTVNDIKNEIDNNANQAKVNIEKLLKLSEFNNKKTDLDSKTINKIFQRARTNRYVLNVESAKEEQPSIFTEEDFQNFEKEYFPTT